VPVETMRVIFKDGTYLEMVVFKKPVKESNWFGKGNGYIDYAVRSDNVDATLAALNGAGVAFSGPYTNGADQKAIYPTKASAPHAIPYVVGYADHAAAIPVSAATHANGATGIIDIGVCSKDPQATKGKLEKVLGAGPTEDHGQSVRFAAGSTAITVTNAWNEALQGSLLVKGEAPYNIKLSGGTAGAKLNLSGLDIEFAG